MVTMSFLGYLRAFFVGVFLANAIPHFVMGVCGLPFPSPFAKPPGKGNSSPIVNVLWGWANIVIGLWLLSFRLPQDILAWALTLLGALLISLQLAWHFGKVQAGKR
jgi:hypothetical protein